MRLCGAAFLAILSVAADESWLEWDARRAEAIGKAAYEQGRVGGLFDTRLLKTERSYNYKLAATWLHADVIRASARLVQIANRLSDDDALALVAEAEMPGHTIVMVEIDPREGSGVIPSDWSAFFASVVNGEPGVTVRGNVRPALRNARAAAGVQRRNYDYDRFWVVFPLRREDGVALFGPNTQEAELTVRIYDREGTVRWKVPPNVLSLPQAAS